MDRSTINTILAIAIPFALSTGFALYIRWSNNRYQEAKKGVEDRTTKLADVTMRLEKIEREQAALTAQAAPINAVFQAILIKQLTHFHTPDMDALMVKLGDVDHPPTITEAEEVQLAKALKERAKELDISDNERDAAIALPIIIRMVKREAEAVANGAKFADVKVVGLLPEGEEEKPA